MANFFSSSIGKKLIMSLAGIFLLSFLVVHMGINLLLIIYKSREPFNMAAHFMGTNPVVKLMEIVLFGGLLLHMVYGGIVSLQNMVARGKERYKKANHSQLSYFSKYMLHSAIIVTIFLVIHLADFYVKAKFLNGAQDVIYGDKKVHDLGLLVIEKFKLWPYSAFYVVSLIFLAFHLHHGFQSAFQTLGINHKTYTPLINFLGLAYSIVIPLGFIAIPVYIYFFY